MRVLVAGRNAKVLATAAGTFANDLEIHTAATKAASFALLGRVEFDLIVACETLADGSGLEVLSHVAVNTPNTLRIFAARPATLSLLEGELGLFGLFRTLPYPINFRKLWAAISLAREACVEDTPAPAGPGVRHVVLEETWGGPQLRAVTATEAARPRKQGAVEPARTRLAQKALTTAAPADATTVTWAARPTTRSVTPAARVVTPAARVATPPTRVATPASQAIKTPARGRAQPATRQQSLAPTRVIAAAAQRQPPAARQEITSGMRAAARYAAAHSGRGSGRVPPSRIPESDTFKRAPAQCATPPSEPPSLEAPAQWVEE